MQLRTTLLAEQFALLGTQGTRLAAALNPLLVPTPDVQRLLWIPGIGRIVAFMILLEVDGIALALVSCSDTLDANRLSGLSKANLQGRDLTRGGLTLIYERHALHKCVKDCGSLRLECFRIEDLDDERLTRPQRESRHSVSVADVRQTIDPCIHVPPVECWEAENGRRLVVKGIPIADCCAVQLNE